MIPLAQEGSSSDRRGCPYSSRARRSNSSEALLDRSSLPDDSAPRNGMPPRGGPYKSSETLTDGKLRHIQLGSPERDVDGSVEQAKMRLSMGGRGAGGGYNELLMDYIWGKQQRMQLQHQLFQSTGRIWQDMSSPRSSTAAVPPHANGFSHSQVHLPSTAPPYSPMVLRGSQAELRRVKVTRTKSCGPFIPLQQHGQDAILLSAYESPLPASGTTTSSIPNLHPYQTELSGPSFSRRPPQLSLPTPEDSTRSLHKALALEGLRDWYLRNALGYPSAASKGHEAGISRLSHPHPLVHQAQSVQGEAANLYRPPIPQSASFHGHPLHGRSVLLFIVVLCLCLCDLGIIPTYITCSLSTQSRRNVVLYFKKCDVIFMACYLSIHLYWIRYTNVHIHLYSNLISFTTEIHRFTRIWLQALKQRMVLLLWPQPFHLSSCDFYYRGCFIFVFIYLFLHGQHFLKLLPGLCQHPDSWLFPDQTHFHTDQITNSGHNSDIIMML